VDLSGSGLKVIIASWFIFWEGYTRVSMGELVIIIFIIHYLIEFYIEHLP